MTPNYHEECVICTEPDYNQNDDSKSLVVTICGHHFHYGCLSQWCNINNSCPSCRTKNVLSPNQLSVMTPTSPSNNPDNDDNHDYDNHDNNSFIFDGLISSGSTATTASNVSPYILNRINYDTSNIIINNNEERNNSNIIINNLGNYQERNNPDYFNNTNIRNNINIIIENNINNYRSRAYRHNFENY
tara:strand:- start:58 stop:621 length:564 start_codon:yes stop_codon:yes gene_type:complete